MSEYGQDEYGGAPFGGKGEIAQSAVAVTVDEPAGPVTTPTVLVEWSLVPSGGQVEYRVEVEILGVTVHNTGWIASTALSHPIELVPLGISDTDAVSFRVFAHEGNRGLAGAGVITQDVTLGQPTVAYIEPDPLAAGYSETQVHCQWSYVDTQGIPQKRSRVRLLLGQQLLYDSGWQENITQEWDVPFLLFDGSRYTIGLRVENDNGVESVGAT